MAHQQNKKRKRRNYKYHAVTFKLSAGQYRSLRNYCKARGTTPIKLIKKNIERFITAYEYDVPQDLYLILNVRLGKKVVFLYQFIKIGLEEREVKFRSILKA